MYIRVNFENVSYIEIYSSRFIIDVNKLIWSIRYLDKAKRITFWYSVLG